MDDKKITHDNMPEVMGEMYKDLKELKKALNQPQKKEETFKDRREAMEKLKIKSYTTIIRLEREGIINPIKVGGKFLYRDSELENIKDFL